MVKQLLIFLLITLYFLFTHRSFSVGGLIIPSSAYAEESLYFIHQDHLGSSSMVTDDQGNVVSKQVYYPYGSTRHQSSVISHQSSRQYTSQISDVSQTGLYYYNARYYSPQFALFNQADIYEGPNRYVYVNGNPINSTDPSGYQKKRGSGGGSQGSRSQSSSGLTLSITEPALTLSQPEILNLPPISASGYYNSTNTIPLPGTSEWDQAVALMPKPPPMPTIGELLSDPVTGPVLGATFGVALLPFGLAANAAYTSFGIWVSASPPAAKILLGLGFFNTVSDIMGLVNHDPSTVALTIADPTGFAPLLRAISHECGHALVGLKLGIEMDEIAMRFFPELDHAVVAPTSESWSNLSVEVKRIFAAAGIAGERVATKLGFSGNENWVGTGTQSDVLKILQGVPLGTNFERFVGKYAGVAEGLLMQDRGILFNKLVNYVAGQMSHTQVISAEEILNILNQ